MKKYYFKKLLFKRMKQKQFLVLYLATYNNTFIYPSSPGITQFQFSLGEFALFLI